MPESINDRPVSAFSIFTKMAIDAWDTCNARVTKLLDTLPEDRFNLQTAPGRNTGHYIIGHLVAIHDALLPMLEFGERM